MLAGTLEVSQTALKAANAYKNIIRAIDDASKAAMDADTAALAVSVHKSSLNF